MKNYKPKVGEEYCFADLTVGKMYSLDIWTGDKYDQMLFDRNLIFKTKEECIKETKSLLKAIKLKRLNTDVKF